MLNIIYHIIQILCSDFRRELSCPFEDYEDLHLGSSYFNYFTRDTETGLQLYPGTQEFENPRYVPSTAPAPTYRPSRVYHSKKEKCKENETYNNILGGIELILSNLLTSLTNTTDKEMETVFSDILSKMTTIDVDQQSGGHLPVANLNKSALKAVDDNLLVITQGVEKIVKACLTKLDTMIDIRRRTVMSEIASVIEALGLLTDAEMGALIRDTLNGTQKQLFQIIDIFSGSVLVLFGEQEKEIVSKSSQVVNLSKAVINSLIMKYFKEFEKSLKALNTATKTEVKKVIEKLKDTLKTNQVNTFTFVLNVYAYLETSPVRKCVESATGCELKNPFHHSCLSETGVPLARGRIAP